MNAERRFEAIFRANVVLIDRYARRRVGDDGDEVTAETFTVAWRRIDDAPEDLDQARLWLYGIARGVVANVRRSRRRRAALTQRVEAEPTSPDGQFVDSVDVIVIGQALRKLSTRDREILMLHAWEELSHQEIAAVMNCAVSTVGVRIHRARKRLRRILGEPFAASGTNLKPIIREER